MTDKHSNKHDFDDDDFAESLREFQQLLGINRKKTLAQRIGEFLGGLTVVAILAIIVSIGVLAVVYLWSLILAL